MRPTRDIGAGIGNGTRVNAEATNNSRLGVQPGSIIRSNGSFLEPGHLIARQAYFESACDHDISSGTYVKIGVVGGPYVTNTAIWSHSSGDTLIRFLCPGRFHFIFRYCAVLNFTSNTFSTSALDRLVTFTLKTIDNSSVATSLWWQAKSSIVYPGSHGAHKHTADEGEVTLTHPAFTYYTMGTISCVLNVLDDLQDGGLAIAYSQSGNPTAYNYILDENCSNVTIVGPLL